MARVKIAGTSGASENTIVFSSAGGHSHNGQNSSLIDSTAYSMYDFSPTFVGTEVNPDRAVRQENNRIAFEDLIKRVVNNSVLAPAGIRLEPGSLNGSLIIANTITANQLAANTITASEISAGTITANELSSNIVLINNRITSQNWNGTILANGTILSNNIGSAGWAITNTHAVFDSTLIRGSIAANSLVTPNLTISNTGAIISTSFNVTAGGNVTATNANITGTITSGSGAIGGWTIDTARIYGGSTYLYSNGSMSIGATTLNANGRITNGGFTLSAAGALTATGANISGAITATSGTFTGTVNASGGTFDGYLTAGSSSFGRLDNINGYYQGININGTFQSCFIRGNGGEVYFRADNGSQWIKFENGSVRINAVGFSLDGTSAVFSGSVSTGALTATGGSIAGWSFTSSQLSSGGTTLNSNGTITIGVNSDSALRLNSGSDISMYASAGGTSSIFFYRDGYGGTDWDSKIEQSAAGNFIIFGNDFNGNYYATLIVRSYAYSGIEARSVDRGVNDDTLAVTRVWTSTAGYNTDITTATQMIQFFKKNKTLTSTGVGYIRATGASTVPSFVAGSDERLKDDIEIYGTPLIEDIKNINVYNWYDKDDVLKKNKVIGFLAKEFYPKYTTVITGKPDEVDKNGDPVYMQMAREDLIPHMFGVIKHLVNKVDELERRIENV